MDFDPREFDRVAFLVERISRNIEKIANDGEEITDEAEKTAKVLEKTEKRLTGIDRILDNMKRTIEESGEVRFEFFGEKFQADLERSQLKLEAWSKEAKRQFTEARGALNVGGSITGLTSVASGVSALKNQLFAGMPMSGILGMALWGALRKEEFDAAGRRALYQFEAIGGASTKYLGKLTEQSRAIYNLWGSMGEEILKVNNTFAQFSVSGDDVMQKASVSAGALFDDIGSVSLAVDMLNAASEGTSAQFIGETMINAGLGAKEASDQVFTLAAALREAKLNYAVFGAGLVQATSSLRIQNQELGHTTQFFLGLEKAFRLQNMSKERAAQQALSGTQAAMSAVGSLPDGLRGYIGQQLGDRGVEGFKDLKGGFARYVQMQFGMREGKGNFVGEVFTELRKIAARSKGEGSKREQELNQIGALQALGISSPEAARAIILGSNATKHLLTPAQKSAKFQEDLLGAFKKRSDLQSSFERDMRVIQDHLAQVGSDMLTFTMASSLILIENIRLLPIRMNLRRTEAQQTQLDMLDSFTLKMGGVQWNSIVSATDRLKMIAETVRDSGAREGFDQNVKMLETYQAYQEKLPENAGSWEAETLAKSAPWVGVQLGKRFLPPGMSHVVEALERVAERDAENSRDLKHAAGQVTANAQKSKNKTKGAGAKSP